MKKEVRMSVGSEVRAELRGEGADSKRVIKGYAAVFEKLSQELGSYVRFFEKIRKGAFAESISKQDVRALWSHNPDLVLGRTGNKTLRVWEDDHGLAFELELPDTTLGRDAYTSIERGDVSGMSFGFDVSGEEVERGDGNKPTIRTLTKIELFEVSPTAFPAYEQTDVSTRGLGSSTEAFEKNLITESSSDLRAKLASAESWRPRF